MIIIHINDKTKRGDPAGVTCPEHASIRNSPLAMPRQCKAQLDIYKKALAEEDNESSSAPSQHSGV